MTMMFGAVRWLNFCLGTVICPNIHLNSIDIYGEGNVRYEQ